MSYIPYYNFDVSKNDLGLDAVRAEGSDEFDVSSRLRGGLAGDEVTVLDTRKRVDPLLIVDQPPEGVSKYPTSSLPAVIAVESEFQQRTVEPQIIAQELDAPVVALTSEGPTVNESVVDTSRFFPQVEESESIADKAARVFAIAGIVILALLIIAK